VIVEIESPRRDQLNTLTEMEAFMDSAKRLGWKDIILVAPPFHQVRVFITAVSVAARKYPEAKIYNQVGISLSWLERATHSQGTLKGTRREFIHTELDRIQKYFAKGDLVHPSVALDYLNKRDC
jgi:hypothetical protein